jgi:hypothetical protein
MTPQTAKKLVKAFLDTEGLAYTKLTVRTVDFTDLGRDKKMVLTVHGWQPNPKWDAVRAIGTLSGFLVITNTNVF